MDKETKTAGGAQAAAGDSPKPVLAPAGGAQAAAAPAQPAKKDTDVQVRPRHLQSDLSRCAGGQAEGAPARRPARAARRARAGLQREEPPPRSPRSRSSRSFRLTSSFATPACPLCVCGYARSLPALSPRIRCACRSRWESRARVSLHYCMRRTRAVLLIMGDRDLCFVHRTQRGLGGSWLGGEGGTRVCIARRTRLASSE